MHIIYDGAGDSGCIDTVDYTDQDGKPVTGVKIEKLTEAQVMYLFYDLTQARHPVWENDDGAYGEFQWDLSVDTLFHTHSDRYTEYDTRSMKAYETSHLSCPIFRAAFWRAGSRLSTNT